jgi:hypothetical protein
VSSVGDAGATTLALAVQPDGKILAAGLVFFQVPTTQTGAPFTWMAAVGAAVCVGVLAALTVRRARMRSFDALTVKR